MPDLPPAIEMAIRSAAEKTGVPSNLALRLAWVESRNNPTAVSPAGARGLFQIMPATGKSLGLETEEDFFNPEKSALAGLTYFKKQYRRFGSWWLALAAYNRGPNWLRRNPDYHKWPPELLEYVSNVYGKRPGGAPSRPLDIPVEVRKLALRQ